MQPSLAALYKMARVKKLWNPGGGQEMAVMVGLWKNFYNNNQFNLLPHLSFTRNQYKLMWIIAIEFFCHKPTITAISWPPPGFYNFFTLCKAARLGYTFFYSLNGCFWVNFTSFCNLTFLCYFRERKWFMSVYISLLINMMEEKITIWTTL